MQEVYKVHFDGSHYYGTKYINSLPKVKVNAEGEVFSVPFCSDIQEFDSENISRNKGKSVKRDNSFDDFKKVFNSALDYSFTKKMKKAETYSFIRETLVKQFGDILFYKNKANKADIISVDDFIKMAFVNRSKNIYYRKKRFEEKAYINSFNYFCTFTYDDKKQSENEFKVKIKKCFSNLHSRKGWKYMYVFERGEGGRLHIHGLFSIPKGSMQGNIRVDKRFDTNDRCMKISHINDFFEKRFGRNDFSEIEDIKKNVSTLNYILKYIGKSEERVIYSRGLPQFVFVKSDEDIICIRVIDKAVYYIFFDDLFSRCERVPMRC